MATASYKNILSYKAKLKLSLLGIFALFNITLIIFQYQREQTYREKMLESRLQSYADIVAETLETEGLKNDSAHFYKLVKIFPEDLRLTVITRSGRVKYESSYLEPEEMKNHLNRPEIIQALNHKEGNNIRTSTSTGLTYFYYAQSYGSFIVRVALPYDVSVQDFMKADHIFIWFTLLIFPFICILLIILSDHFGKSIVMLRHFIKSAESGLIDYDKIDFPHSELGELSRKILTKYKELEESNRQITKERERLLRHFHYFEEGIAIFTAEKEKIYANPTLLQYINTILDRPTANIKAIWAHPTFAPAIDFLNQNSSGHHITEEAPIFRFNISAGSTCYAVQILVYSDGSFEMTLSNITHIEKNKKLKQQMSNNITHELRTPVSSISGYIETILNCENLSEERRRYFLERAYAQVVRLTALIRDVSLISKTEEAPESMPIEEVDINEVLNHISEELQPRLAKEQIRLQITVPEHTILTGNYSLVYSIFRNLMENSIRYAGVQSNIKIECYNTDSEYYYFRYYDTGKGVEESHLPRLFERFYRVSEGRTRDDGGTGLGLSIVRNAIVFHHGNISVRNRKCGGLEFLFTLKRTGGKNPYLNHNLSQPS